MGTSESCFSGNDYPLRFAGGGELQKVFYFVPDEKLEIVRGNFLFSFGEKHVGYPEGNAIQKNSVDLLELKNVSCFPGRMKRGFQRCPRSGSPLPVKADPAFHRGIVQAGVCCSDIEDIASGTVGELFRKGAFTTPGPSEDKGEVGKCGRGSVHGISSRLRAMWRCRPSGRLPE